MQSMNSPLITIIIPCYNSEVYLAECLASVLSSAADFEVLVIDDGSVDRTVSIAKNYALRDSRLRIIKKENGGYVSAVNTGLDNTKGEYVMFVGSDDSLANNILKELCDEIGRNHPDVIGFRAKRSDKKPDCSEDIGEFIHIKSVNLAKVEESFPKESSILFTRDTAKCYKRSLNEELRYFGKYGIDADGIYSMLMCANATSFSFLPINGYRWAIHENSLSSRKRTPEIEKDILWNWYRFFQAFSLSWNENLWPESVRAYASSFVERGLRFIQTSTFSKDDITPLLRCQRLLSRQGIKIRFHHQLALRFPHLYRAFKKCLSTKTAKTNHKP